MTSTETGFVLSIGKMPYKKKEKEFVKYIDSLNIKKTNNPWNKNPRLHKANSLLL